MSYSHLVYIPSYVSFITVRLPSMPTDSLCCVWIALMSPFLILQNTTLAAYAWLSADLRITTTLIHRFVLFQNSIKCCVRQEGRLQEKIPATPQVWQNQPTVVMRLWNPLLQLQGRSSTSITL